MNVLKICYRYINLIIYSKFYCGKQYIIVMTLYWTKTHWVSSVLILKKWNTTVTTFILGFKCVEKTKIYGYLVFVIKNN